MYTWFSSLWPHTSSLDTPVLTVRIHRRDTLLYQKQLNGTHSFSVGRSMWNGCSMDLPSLPTKHFPLIRYRAKRPYVYITDSMRGTLVRNERIFTFHEWSLLYPTERAPHGFQMELPRDTALNIFIDGILIRLDWERSIEPSSGEPAVWLTPTHVSA